MHIWLHALLSRELNRGSNMDHTSKNARMEAGVLVAGWRAEATNQSRQAESSTDSAILKSRSTSTEAQRAKLLALLRIGPQTTYSLRKHGLAQCAARVWDLRAAGHIINTERVTAIDSDGFTHVGVARYSLVQEALRDAQEVTSSSEVANG